VASRKDLEHVNAAWLILPVGNFVAALVGPGLDPAYTMAMQFWFAFALMAWVLLFALTFAKAVLVTDNGGCAG
jgi:tellurite resistance protein TehA-like permease